MLRNGSLFAYYSYPRESISRVAPHYGDRMSTIHQRPATDPQPSARRPAVWRSVGLGIITGAADDDPSAVGTYASVGARLGPAFLWIAPAVFPMMFAVVYLSAKLGQVTGQGLFEAIRHRFPRWILYSAL